MNLMTEHKAYRILVVDDDELLNSLFCSFLNSKGFDTFGVTSVSDAKNTLQMDSGIDLILLDYQLGDGVGIDLLTPELASTYLSSAPVIMISANEEPVFLEQCFSCGVNDYIIKPVNLSLLALKVEALIKSVSMQRLITAQNIELERFKKEAEREEKIAKFTYEYLLRQNSDDHEGVDVWLKSFAAFSGDMMLVRKSPSGILYFILGDATGHGLSAAITIMPVVTVFNSMVAKGFHLQQIVTELNHKLVTDTPVDRFVAATLIEVDPIRREFSIWNGGMPPAFWVDNGKILHEFRSTHMALGIMDKEYFDATVTTIDLPAKGFLFTYSDGLSEQENADEVPFSVARVKEVIQQKPTNLILEMTQQLKQFAGTDEYCDDVTLCVIEPEKIFGDIEKITQSESVLAADDANCFAWQVRLCGRQLEHCDIPPLCNHFLQQLGLSQPACQKIFSIVAEMVSNAIDHGVLGLDSSIKERPDGFADYYQLREERLKKLTNDDYVSVHMQWETSDSGALLNIEVTDSGKGYDFSEYSKAGTKAFSGRGLQLINRLSEFVEIKTPGNKIRATIK